MVSEIMPRCVFELHKHARIACTPFSKRGQKITDIMFFVFWKHCSKMVEVASKVCPKDAKRVPQWTQMSARQCPKGAQRCPGMPKGCSKGGQGHPSGAQGSPKGAQGVPKGA